MSAATGPVGAVTILTAACANRLCSAGRGMPLPYNGGYHETAAGTGRQCLPEIATGAKRPRNDKSENLAPLNLCHDHCRSAWRSLSAATDAIGRCVFIDTFFRIHSFPCPAPTANSPARRKKKLRSFDRSFMLALPIFPCSHPQSIVGANELNFCVRDGNRCTLTAINTNYFGTHPEN